MRASSNTLFASSKVETVAPLMLDCSLDTRYKISGLAWRAIQLKLPTTLLNCFSSPLVTGSAGFLCLAISTYVVFLVLSATSRRMSCPDASNCLPQNLSRPSSFLPTSNLVRRRSTIACPDSVHAHRKSSTCVVRTTSTTPFSRYDCVVFQHHNQESMQGNSPGRDICSAECPRGGR